MGGVDKHDCLAPVNVWLEYNKYACALGMKKKNIIDLRAFRQTVAENLIFFKNSPKRGRLSTSADSPRTLKKSAWNKDPVKNQDMRATITSLKLAVTEIIRVVK